MKVFTSEEALWADGVAARLRQLRMDVAGEDPSARKRRIASEVEQALQAIPADKRKAYLDALGDRLPESKAAMLAVSSALASPETHDSPEAMAVKLAAAAGGLSETSRREIAERLKKAGFAVVEQRPQAPAMAAGLSQETAAKLFLEPGRHLDVDRAHKLLAALTEWMTLLEQPAWKLWKEVNPNAKLKRDGIPNGDLKAMIGKYLAGDAEVSTEQIIAVLQKSRRLVAGLMIALGMAGRQYASAHHYRFSPLAIEDIARTEKKWSESLEAACWRKYRELAADSSEAAIEKELKDAIAKSAEEVMIGPKADT